LIIISVPAFANAEQFGSTSFQNTKPNLEKNTIQVGRHLGITLSENVGIRSNDQPPADQQTIPQNKMITLSDGVIISSNDNDHNFISLLPNNIPVTTLDRILNPERIRISGRTIVVDNQMSYDEQTTKLSSPITGKASLHTNAFNFENNDNIFSFIPQLENNLFSYKPTGILFIQSDVLQNKINGINQNTLDNDAPIVILLFIPITGYILIRSNGNKIPARSKQILSFCFIIILVSSAAISPYSIATHYWGIAYAETQNQTQNTSSHSSNISNAISQDNLSNVTIGKANNVKGSNSQQNYTNYNLPINQTSTPTNPSMPLQSNPTLVSKASKTFSSQLSITDSVEFHSTKANPFNSTSKTTNSLLEKVGVTDTLSTNSISKIGIANVSPSTQVSITDTLTLKSTSKIGIANVSPSTQVSITDTLTLHSTSNIPRIPNATASWQFNSLPKNATVVGKPTIANDTNGKSLQLQGNQYLSQNGATTRTLSALTISAWVKPDYSKGSSQFTVISKQNQFILGINNEIPPQKIATFSIFDGIRWSTVNSTVPIGENWTNLAATFNGSAISIYVNGTLQSTYHLASMLTVTVNGTLTTKTVDEISSRSDIVMGAYLNSLRSESMNLFAGSIQSVNLYDSLLSPSQIEQLYTGNPLSQTLPSQSQPQSQNKSLNLTDSVIIKDTINQSISNQSTKNKSLNLTDSVIINDAILQNGTSLDSSQPQTITPELNSTKQTYLITETPQLQFTYLSNSGILKTTEKKITKELAQLNRLEQRLNNTATFLNVTQTTKATDNYNIPQPIDLAKQQIINVEKQIVDTKQKIIIAQQQIQNALAQSQNQTQINNVTNQVLDINQVLNQTKQQVIEAAQQIKSIRMDIKNQADKLTQLSANMPSDQGIVQQGSWQGQNETITVQVTGPDGNPIHIQPRLEKMLDGQFNIALSSTRDARPVLYIFFFNFF
jgi:hypothetical protein